MHLLRHILGLAGMCAIALVTAGAQAAPPHPWGAPGGAAREPETRTLPAAEADAVLVRDWLFQVDDNPTIGAARQELKWTRELAARIVKLPGAPGLSTDLHELSALEKKYAGITEPVRQRPSRQLPGLLGHWDADELNRGVINAGTQLAGIAGGNYTICAWIKTTSTEADIVGSGVGNGHLLLMTYRGVVRGHHWTPASGNVLDGKTTVNDGRWHHVAQVVDDNSLSLFVDGKLDATLKFQGQKTVAADPLLVGARSYGYPGAWFRGTLDDVCAFDRPLTGDQITRFAEESRQSLMAVDERAEEFYLAVRRVKRRIMFQNPLVDFRQVLFVDNPYPAGSEWAHEARHRDGIMAVPGGRLLVLDGLHPGGKLRKLAPRSGTPWGSGCGAVAQTVATEREGVPLQVSDAPASFWRPDLSFDARKVLFCMKPATDKSFHLYEINLDGTGLRQLTNSDYDDLDPIYLPDGHIMFSTTRVNTYVRCMPYTYCYVLARCDADGRKIYIISQGNEPDWLPTLLADGRVIYTRWEYTDKALWRIQSLWTLNPDGTDGATFWGNQSVWPDMLIEPRPIPGSHRVMFTGAAHHDWFAGSIGILDQRQGFNFPAGLTKITAEVPWPECGQPPVDPIESSNYHRAGNFTAYKTPYPLSEELFLVSARGSANKYRLYLMDVHGNRELIYEGAHNIWHAMPVRPRQKPSALPDRVAWPRIGNNHEPAQPGVLFSGDVYQGTALPRGTVRYLRVIQMEPRTYSTWVRDQMPHQHQGPTISILQSDGIKKILGTVPVNEDGSVAFEVPPGKALHFQLLDENQRAIQTMRSFTGVMPGEKRGCVGCHERHTTAPKTKRAAALARSPARLTPPPWGAEFTFSYEQTIQPILERHCGKCHLGDGAGRKQFDLTLRPGAGVFKEPYVTLVGGSVYHGAKTTDPQASLAGCLPVETWPTAGTPQSVQTYPPMKYLSYTSKLVNHYAGSGKHHDVKMSESDLTMLSAWVDLVCPYRSEEELRAIPDPEFAGIEHLPIRPRVKTAPVIDRFNLAQDSMPNR